MSAAVVQDLFESVDGPRVIARPRPCEHCGTVEVSTYVQTLNHTPMRGTCTTLALRRAQTEYAAREAVA